MEICWDFMTIFIISIWLFKLVLHSSALNLANNSFTLFLFVHELRPKWRCWVRVSFKILRTALDLRSVRSKLFCWILNTELNYWIKFNHYSNTLKCCSAPDPPTGTHTHRKIVGLLRKVPGCNSVCSRICLGAPPLRPMYKMYPQLWPPAPLPSATPRSRVRMEVLAQIGPTVVISAVAVKMVVLLAR